MANVVELGQITEDTIATVELLARERSMGKTLRQLGADVWQKP